MFLSRSESLAQRPRCQDRPSAVFVAPPKQPATRPNSPHFPLGSSSLRPSHLTGAAFLHLGGLSHSSSSSSVGNRSGAVVVLAVSAAFPSLSKRLRTRRYSPAELPVAAGIGAPRQGPGFSWRPGPWENVAADASSVTVPGLWFMLATLRVQPTGSVAGTGGAPAPGGLRLSSPEAAEWWQHALGSCGGKRRPRRQIPAVGAGEVYNSSLKLEEERKGLFPQKGSSYIPKLRGVVPSFMSGGQMADWVLKKERKARKVVPC